MYWKTVGSKLLDVFAGMGAMSLGFEEAGLQPVLGIEKEEPQCRTYAANRKGVPVLMGDCRTFPPEELRKIVGKVDAVIGGVPCEPFSGARVAGTGADAVKDSRKNLIRYALGLVKAFRPRVFAFENVWRAVDSPSWKRAVKEMSAAGYRIAVWKLNSADFGVPQLRKRAFFVGVAGSGSEPEPPEPTVEEPVTLRKAFGDLGAPGSRKGDPLHVEDGPLVGKIAAAAKVAPIGGQLSGHANYRSFNTRIVDPDKPSLTMMPGSARLVHWSRKRFLTPRELARIQGVPDSYQFPVRRGKIRSLLGDGVPVGLAKAVAERLLSTVSKADAEFDGAAFDAAAALVEKAVGVGEVGKGLPNETAEAGIHLHNLVREGKRTKEDGAHPHVYVSGEISFWTEEDGEHGHPLAKGDADVIAQSGAHAHKVVIDEKTARALDVEPGEYETEEDGAHDHQLQAWSTALDGLHQHVLKIGDKTFRTLTAGEYWVHAGKPDQEGSPDAPPATRLARLAKAEKQEPRSAPEALLRQASRARDKDRLTLGEFFFQPKPTQPAGPEEAQTVKALVDLFRENPGWFPVMVQKKYDGARHQIHKDGDKVKILSEDGGDNTARLPGVVEAVRKLKEPRLVLDAELELWDGRQHLPREAMAGLLSSKDEPDDADVVANVFDVMLAGGDGDIHAKPLEERLKVLAGLGLPQSTMNAPDLRHRLNEAPSLKAGDAEDLERATRMIRELPGSEGVVVKQARSKFPLETATGDTWVKFHNAAAIRGVVVGRKRTAGGAWVYTWGIRTGGAKVEETAEAGGAELLVVGDTFATSLDLKDGARILVETETLNVTNTPGGVRVTAFVPRVLGDYSGKPDSVRSAQARAKRELVLQVKDVDESGETTFRPVRKVDKQEDPFVEVPDEDGTYRYVVQHHWRGKSLHADFRVELRKAKLLVGWTLNTQIAGVVKEPVLTLAQARAWTRRMDALSKIDWRDGEWALRSKRGATKPVRTEISSQRKTAHPFAWLDVEGRTKETGEGEAPPPGATRMFPGVFHVVDQGTVEYGVQKPWFHEYFVRGKGMNYRLMFRQLRLGKLEKARHSYHHCMRCEKVAPRVDVLWADGRGRAWFCDKCYPVWKKELGTDAEIVGTKRIIGPRAPSSFNDVHKSALPAQSAELHPAMVEIAKQRVLPPSTPQGETAFEGEPVWLAIQPDDMTPNAISADAVKKRFIPPLGVSALPKAVRSQVPKEFRYWERRTRADALKTRDALVLAMKDDEVEIDVDAPFKVSKTTMQDADFALQEQTWRGPISIRVGPSRRLWHLRLDTGGAALIVVKMFDNPLDNDEVAAEVGSDSRKASLTLEGPLKPGHYLNPTKDTPSHIEILDKGKAEILSVDKDRIAVRLDGKKIRGLFEAVRSGREWLWAPAKEKAVHAEKRDVSDHVFEVEIQKLDKERRLVVGVVLEPGTVDAQKDTVSAEVIENAAGDFLANFNQETRLGVMHKIFGEIGVELRESWITPQAMKIGGQSVKKGTWIMTLKIVKDKLWDAVKAGEITGLSIGGVATTRSVG